MIIDSCPPENGGGTFIQNATATVSKDTGLGPFRKQGGNYWTSDDARGLVHATTPTKKCRRGFFFLF